jgi:hypothetical protein
MVPHGKDMTDRSNEPDAPIELRLTLGHTGDEMLYLRVSPAHAEDLQETLEAEGVYSGQIVELSAGPSLLVLAGSFAGGLGGLAAALTAFFHRNRHKRIRFTHGDTTIELEGYSDDGAKALFDAALEAAKQRQLERDAEWERVMKEMDDPEE